MTRNEKYIAAFQPHLTANGIKYLIDLTQATVESYVGLIERMDYIYIGIIWEGPDGGEYTLVDPSYIYDSGQDNTEEQIEIAQGITGLPIETVRKIFEENDL